MRIWNASCHGALAAALSVAAALGVGAGTAAADVVGIAVMNTGSEGPVMHCPHTIGAGISRPTEGTFSITVDGTPLPVRWDAPTESVEATWVPDRLGWHVIDVTHYKPRGVSRGRLAIEVRRAGLSTGSSCLSNGVFLPIDPRTGGLG